MKAKVCFIRLFGHLHNRWFLSSKHHNCCTFRTVIRRWPLILAKKKKKKTSRQRDYVNLTLTVHNTKILKLKNIRKLTAISSSPRLFLAKISQFGTTVSVCTLPTIFRISTAPKNVQPVIWIHLNVFFFALSFMHLNTFII